MSRVFARIWSYHFCKHLPQNEDDAQKKKLLLFDSLCEYAWQTLLRESFSAREDRLSNVTILEQSVYVASHQTGADVMQF